MEFFRIKKSIPFMRHALVFNVISFVTFLLAVFSWPPKGCTFHRVYGGTVIEAPFKQAADLEKIREEIDQARISEAFAEFGSSKDVLIRLPLKVSSSSQNEEMEKRKTHHRSVAPPGLD